MAVDRVEDCVAVDIAESDSFTDTFTDASDSFAAAVEGAMTDGDADGAGVVLVAGDTAVAAAADDDDDDRMEDEFTEAVESLGTLGSLLLHLLSSGFSRVPKSPERRNKPNFGTVKVPKLAICPEEVPIFGQRGPENLIWPVH